MESVQLKAEKRDECESMMNSFSWTTRLFLFFSFNFFLLPGRRLEMLLLECVICFIPVSVLSLLCVFLTYIYLYVSTILVLYVYFFFLLAIIIVKNCIFFLFGIISLPFTSKITHFCKVRSHSQTKKMNLDLLHKYIRNIIYIYYINIEKRLSRAQK